MAGMKGSLVLGKIGGIKIVVHWTFTLLLLWVLFSTIQQGGNQAATGGGGGGDYAFTGDGTSPFGPETQELWDQVRKDMIQKTLNQFATDVHAVSVEGKPPQNASNPGNGTVSRSLCRTAA